MPRVVPLPNEYFLHQGEVYRVVLASRGTDEILLERLSDGKRWTVLFSTFKVAFKRVWKVGEVAKLIGRTPRSIYRYESKGQIEKPTRYSDRFGRELRFYTKEQVLDLYDDVAEIHQGRPRKDKRVVNNALPGKAHVLSVFRERFEE